MDKRIAVPGARGGARAKIDIDRAHARTVIAQGVPAAARIQRVIALAQDEPLVPAAAKDGIGIVRSADLDADVAGAVHIQLIGAAIAILDHPGSQVGIDARRRRAIVDAGNGPIGDIERVIAAAPADADPGVAIHRDVEHVIAAGAQQPDPVARVPVCRALEINQVVGAADALVYPGQPHILVDVNDDRPGQACVINAIVIPLLAFAEQDYVIPCRAVDDIVAVVFTGVDQVIPGGAVQRVVAIGAGHRVFVRCRGVEKAAPGDVLVRAQRMSARNRADPGDRAFQRVPLRHRGDRGHRTAANLEKQREQFVTGVDVDRKYLADLAPAPADLTDEAVDYVAAGLKFREADAVDRREGFVGGDVHPRQFVRRRAGDRVGECRVGRADCESDLGKNVDHRIAGLGRVADDGNAGQGLDGHVGPPKRKIQYPTGMAA